jgi:superfamily II RNA helicase
VNGQAGLVNTPLRVPVGDDADSVLGAFVEWVGGRGLSLYPAQEEALVEVFTGSNVILATPTGSGKSLVALGAHLAALADGRRSVYTAPIKALVSEKFFDLCDTLGAERVGMLTGDAAVNPDAPVICCTAEVLANQALREGPAADVGLVVMDEFHFYADPDRGWAWQVPLLELTRAGGRAGTPSCQFLLMSATLVSWPTISAGAPPGRRQSSRAARDPFRCTTTTRPRRCPRPSPTSSRPGRRPSTSCISPRLRRSNGLRA